jgi:hypothetical protein
MKPVFTFLLLLVACACHAQNTQDWNWFCNFESPISSNGQFIIDTQTYHHNSWQIGKPQKPVFSSASSAPNAIVTDTVNPYPTNDTSVFIVKHVKSKFPVIVFSIRFDYKLDIDSGEIAKIEVSGDSGLHWINVMTEDTTYDFDWYSTKPRLDTSVHQWQSFYLSMTGWADAVYSQPGFYPSDVTADTFLYRFTFISDGVQTNKDGWMMDNFHFADHPEAIADPGNDKLVRIYPNPTTGSIHIQSQQHATAQVSVFNTQGAEVYHTGMLPANGDINLTLPDGLYFLKYTSGDIYSVKKLVVSH